MREKKRIIRSKFNFLEKDFPDETLEKMCFTKKRYNTKEECDLKIPEINENREVKLRSYNCPICAGWHLSSK